MRHTASAVFAVAIACLSPAFADDMSGMTVANPAASDRAVRAIQLSGMVKQPGEIWLKALQALPPVTVAISQQTGKGLISATFKGALLWSVLDTAGWTNGPEKNAVIRHTILVSGADGYAAALSEGEIDPMLEGKQVILAYEKNGQPLAAPQLVIPSDAHASRSIHDVVSIEVR